MQVKTIVRFFMTLVIANLLFVPLSIADEMKNVILVKETNVTKIVSFAELTKTAQYKTYVGVIPYYQVNNKTYILLGRKTKDTRKVDAGEYADFGASVKINDVTILQNAATVLTQGTIGKLKVSAQDLKKNGKIIYKQLDPEHDVYYIFYKVSQRQFLKIKKLNVQHARLKASGVANTNLEKDQFVWFNLGDLLQDSCNKDNLQNTFSVKTIDGIKVTANFSNYLIVDCLQKAELVGLSGLM